MLHTLAHAPEHVEQAGFIVSGIKAVFVLIGSVIAAILCGIIAAAKGRNPIGWAVVGLFFSILTLIVVILVPRKRAVR